MSKPLHLPEGREMRLRAAPPTIEYRAADGGAQQPTAFVGQAIVCGVRSEVLGGPGFRFVEIIDAAALDGADISNVEGVFNHNSDCLLGHTRSGSLELTRTADGGLSYRIAYDAEDPDHQRVMRKIERGDVVGSSFMFTASDSDWQNEQTPDGGDLYVRTVRKIDRVYDVCPVTSPAYSDATAAKRSLEQRMKGMKKPAKKKKKRQESTEDKATRQFLEDMIPHHEMALQMANTVLSKVENEEIRAFAQNIIATQSAEIDQMNTWLGEMNTKRNRQHPTPPAAVPLSVRKRQLQLLS